ncbi:DNA polymerase III subunit delta [Synechococcus sp. Nb3U1]|uniref:DNA polymerase III subunit delta n=1 Tax=Synechococcus sp. Nb3U1 TaxID=1914529 RepID=UPI001F3651B7|nr:DNA polymerase III subunit delta [Synechococcus sp. Nb3U1]MCF2969800.1 DNA polymerase III subunit delta [Synechococcus sp. Nb3U1]
MPVYFYWGEDHYRLLQAVQQLREQVLDPDWAAFNYDRLPPESTIAGLNQAMTPPLGAAARLVWLEDTHLTQHCPEDLWEEVERILAQLPPTTHLLLTTTSKPDGRLKSTKILKKTAIVREFQQLAAWDEEGILKQVHAEAAQRQLKLSPVAAQKLAEAVGNESRRLVMELEKLALFTAGQTDAITPEQIEALVPASAYNSFQLAASLRKGDLDQALVILTHLLDQNEPALKVLAVLVGQFRTWLWVRLLLDQGERDPKAIAQKAEIGNPNRVYFLQKEVGSLKTATLLKAMQQLLHLEYGLKQGQPERGAFQAALIQIVAILKGSHA